MREELREALEASDEGLSVRNPKDWFERTNLDELVHVAVAAGVDRGLYGPEYVEAGGYDRYPSVFTFVAARLARILTNAGNRTIAASDLADAHHLASGPYVDVIVSDDKAMRTSFDLFANLVSFRVMPSLEFGEQFRVLHRSRTR